MRAELILRRSKSILRSERFYWILVVNGHTVARSAGAYANAEEARRMGYRVCGGTYTFEFTDESHRRRH